MAEEKINLISDLLVLCKLSEDEIFKKIDQLNDKDIQSLYVQLINKIESAVSDDCIDHFDYWWKILKSLNTLKRDIIADDSFGETNLVVLVCKHNRFNLLQKLFSDDGKILSNIEQTTARCFSEPSYEELHASFYYAIRSCNNDLLDTLINKWPEEYFVARPEELEEVLSKSYEELKLKNIQLSEEIQYDIEDKLINLRFFSTIADNCSPTLETVKERIDLVLDSICKIDKEYCNKEVDESFLFTARFITKNIFILKRHLKSTYNMLPWEEIEFCLIVFISSYSRDHEYNLYYLFILSKERLLFHLRNFHTRLEIAKNAVYSSNKLSELPNLERKNVVAEIIKDFGEFNELYDDYAQVRDIESLKKINEYIELALSVDCHKNEGQVVINRTLQVIGEHLKNTLESPKLSTTKGDLLILTAPRNTRKFLIDLRNSLSHLQALDTKLEIEGNLYKDVQNDFKKIYSVTCDMLYKCKIKIIKSIIIKILDCKDFDEILEIIIILETIKSNLLTKIILETSVNAYTNEEDKLKKLIEDLDKKLIEKTSHEKKLFSELMTMLEPNEALPLSDVVKMGFIQSINTLQSIVWNYPDHQVDINLIRIIKYHAKTALKSINWRVDVKQKKEVGKIVNEILQSVKLRLPEDMDEVLMLFYNILFVAEFKISQVFGIEELRDKMINRRKGRGKRKKINENSEKSLTINYEEELLKKVSLMNSTLQNEMSSGFKTLANKNCKKTLASLEMQILDIMSLIEKSKLWYLNDVLFLDSDYPLLFGKNLRNYLAHGNSLADILICDPKVAILSTAITFMQQSNFKDYKIFGKSVNVDLSELKNKFNESFAMLTNQRNMFIALENGYMEELKKCLRNGADINARDINLWTALHYAAKCPSLEVVKYVVEQKPQFEAVDNSGNSPLLVAVIYGRKHTVEYFLKLSAYSVNSLGQYGKTSLHLASHGGQKDIVELLLQYEANINIRDKHGFFPFHRAVQKCHIEIVDIFIKEGVHVNSEAEVGFTPLHIAAGRGNLEMVNLLLQHKARVNIQSDKGGIPLHLAVVDGHTEVVKALISNGSNVNTQVDDGCTALHFAIEYEFEEIVKMLLDNGAGVNIANTFHRNTPLHYGARCGSKNIVAMLLQKGAIVNLVTSEGCSPLYLAADGGHTEVVDLLIQRDVNINTATNDGNTPLHVSILNNHKDVLKILLRNGAKINQKNNFGMTPLHMGTLHGQTEIIELLITSGAEVNAVNFKGCTPLHYALNNSKDVVDLLIQKNADVKFVTIEGFSLLHIIAMNGGNDENVSLLISYGVCVNSTDKQFSTPLHAAALFGKEKIVKALISQRADVNYVNKNGITALNFAVEISHKNIVEILLNHGAFVNIQTQHPVLNLAVKNNSLEIVKMLVSNGADVNADNGLAIKTAAYAGYKNILKFLLMNSDVNLNILNTSLNIACRFNNKNIIEILSKYGADVNAIIKNVAPLYAAVCEGHVKVVEFLIEKGADVNVVSEYGHTPLHVSARNGHEDMVDMLLKCRAKINVKDDENRSPLEFAVDGGHYHVMKAILQYNQTNINDKGNEGFTLLHIASDKGSLEIVKYLVNEGADVNARNDMGAKPIHYAAREGHQSIVEFFLSKGYNDIYDYGKDGSTLLHYAVSKGQIEVVQYLINQKFDVNRTSDLGVKAVHLAASLGFKDVTELLLNNGSFFDPIIKIFLNNPEPHYEKGDVIQLLELTKKLFESVKSNNHLEVIKCIKNGAFINARNSDNITPLHHASWKGYNNIVEIILRNRANPNVVGKGSSTPLHYASKFGHLNIVILLLSNGAIFNFKNDRGKTNLDFAGNIDVRKLLLLLDNSFKDVQNGNTKVFNDLILIKDYATKMAVTNARNRINNKTLIVTAIENDYPKIKELKRLLEEDDHEEIFQAELFLVEEKYQEALKIYSDILRRKNKTLGPDNPSTLSTRMRISDIIFKKGNFQEALRIKEEIYMKQKIILGERNKDTLYNRSGIALILYYLGRNEEALSIFEIVLREQCDLLGAKHEDTIKTKVHMALVLDGLKRYEEALCYNYEIYEQYKIFLGNSHPYTLTVKNNIALTLSNQEKYEEALKMYEEVYEMRKRVLKPHHSQTLRVRFKIAVVLAKLNRNEESIKLHQELLDIQRITLGITHPDTLNTKCSMGQLLISQNKLIKAFEIFRADLDQIKTVFGPKYELVVTIEKQLKVIEFSLKLQGLDVNIFINIPKKLHNAVNNNELKVVKDLIKNGIDVNCRDSEGRTSMHFAVNSGHIDVLHTLLENEAEVKITTNKGNTSLHTATCKGSKKIVEILLKHVKRNSPSKLEEFINAKTSGGGTTALHIAAKNGSIEILKCIMHYGAIYDVKDNKNKRPIDYTTDQKTFDILKLTDRVFDDAENGNDEILKKLREIKLDSVAVLSARNGQNQTAVQRAFVNNHIDLGKSFLDILKPAN